MPCNCDYMNPTQKEKDSREVCQYLVYVCEQLNIECEKYVDIVTASVHIYGNTDLLLFATQKLCELCSNMTEKQKDSIIYDGKNAGARKLADWWDEHQAADAARLKKEAKEKLKKATAKKALSKLTKEEKDALGLSSLNNIF